MTGDKKLGKIIDECYDKLYREADPPTTLKRLIDTGEGKEKGFYNRYYLDMERQCEIINEVAKNHKLSKYDKQILSQSVLLGGSPNSSKETWKTARGD